MTQTRTKPFVTSRRRFLASSGMTLVGTMAISGGLISCSGPSGEGAIEFTAQEFQLVERLSDMIIPATDTPGAIGAGVPEYINRMMSEWASPATRDKIKSGLAQLDSLAEQEHGKTFVALGETQQASTLEQFEEKCFAASDGPAVVQQDVPMDDAPEEDAEQMAMAGYRELKKLVYRGYYYSEIGCTQELHYELIPGPDARADAPMAEIGKSWAL